MAISGKEIALILAEDFDATEFNGVRRCFLDAGALVSVVGDTPGSKLQDYARTIQVEVDVSYEEARGYEFAAAIIPDGFSPDKIRTNDDALDFVRAMFDTGKIVGTLGRGIQVLITLGALKGKNVTGLPSIQADIENAGAHYYDEPVVVDGNLVTGRDAAHVKEFCDTVITEIERSSAAAA